MTLIIILVSALLVWAIFFFLVAPREMSNILQRDPAARNYFEVIFLYPGLHAIVSHRYAHFFYKHKMFLIARIISQISRMFTGIEIHPGAKIGKGLFIDHGMGIVIGETTEIGDNCTIYQNVTLGGTGKEKGKRHPTIGNNVLIGCGAKVLGPFKVGDNAKIAANAVVLYEVPDNSTAVGVPARVVRVNNQKVSSMDLDQIHIPDPTSQEICKLNKLVHDLEEKLESTHDRKDDVSEDI